MEPSLQMLPPYLHTFRTAELKGYKYGGSICSDGSIYSSYLVHDGSICSTLWDCRWSHHQKYVSCHFDMEFVRWGGDWGAWEAGGVWGLGGWGGSREGWGGWEGCEGWGCPTLLLRGSSGLGLTKSVVLDQSTCPGAILAFNAS